jgi:hypothetical protein
MDGCTMLSLLELYYAICGLVTETRSMREWFGSNANNVDHGKQEGMLLVKLS